jgi:polar amino acid transport system permease protein
VDGVGRCTHPVFVLQGGWPTQFDTSFFKDFLFYKPFIDGAKLTIELAVFSQASGIALGLFAALGRISRSRLPLFRWMSWLYLWLFRGTPLLVQIFFVYFALPDLTNQHVKLDEIWSAFVALALNEGAYMAEIIRAGISSVDSGQTEAAQSLGMTRWLTMRRIVLPQAVRIIIPPTGNEFISMLKNTSLASVISTPELFFQTDQLRSATFHSFEPLAIVSLYYLAMTSVASYFQMHVERHYSRGFTRDVQGPGYMQRAFQGAFHRG